MQLAKLIERFYFGQHGMFITASRWAALHQIAQGILSGNQPPVDHARQTQLKPVDPDEMVRALAGVDKSGKVTYGNLTSQPFDQVAGRYGAKDFRRTPYSLTKSGVAVVPLSGVVAKRISWLDAMCGDFADLAVFDSALALAANDDDVEAIVLDIDSPGGYGLGLEESASLIREIDRTSKPVYAYTDTEMCSAAYWVGAAAREVGVSPSAFVGSVGSYMFLLDYTEAMEKQGVKVEPFVQGKFKAIGHPLLKITDEQRDHVKEKLEEHAEAFRASVRADMPAISRDELEGQHYPGAVAAAKGFADHVVRSLPEFIAAVEGEHGLR